MTLSSTIRTLIGGTVPSMSPPKAAPADTEPLFFLDFRDGRGEAPRAGGVRLLLGGDSGAGAGGVGIEGAGAAGWPFVDTFAS